MPEPLTKRPPGCKGVLRAAAFALALAGILTSALPAAEAGKATTAGKGVKTMQGAPAQATSRKVLPPIDAEVPATTETATFALGWFWGPEARFGLVEGVIRTRVGYAGGTKNHPTYTSLGDHSETLQIDYDPARISYEKLLDIFWDSHDPTVKSWSRQYRSALFYHSEAQKRAIIASKEREEKKRGAKIHTEILPYGGFHLAEFYHQKYQLQLHHEIGREMRAVYPKEADFIASTATARLNGYVSGYGSAATLEKEIHRLGLSPESVKKLTDIVRKLS